MTCYVVSSMMPYANAMCRYMPVTNRTVDVMRIVLALSSASWRQWRRRFFGFTKKHYINIC